MFNLHAQNSKKLAEPVKNSVIQNGVLKEIKGSKYFYTVLVGTPAKLLQYDIDSGKLIKEISIPGINNSWSLVEEGNLLYIAGVNGHLYSFNFLSEKVSDLGKPIENNTVIFCLTKDDSGNIFGGGYPNAGLFQYNSKTGFKILNDKRIQGNKYIRSIAYYNNNLFLGLGTSASLFKFSLNNYQLIKINNPQKLNGFEFVYDLKRVDLQNTPYLVGSFTKNSSRNSFYYNLTNESFVVDESFDINSIISNGPSLFFGKDGFIVEKKKSNNLTQLKKVYSSVIFTDRVNDNLYFVTKNKKVQKLQLSNNSIKTYDLDEKSSSIKINFGFTDDGGNVWTSGYLAGGISKYSKNGKINTFNGLDQAESMDLIKNKLFMGIYPQAKIYVYDINSPWKVNQNPKLIAKVSGQDRPAAIAYSNTSNKVYFGTIPTYGKVGGSLIEIDYDNYKTKTYNNIISNQSIISLLSFANKIYGGSSVSGGLGSNQKASSPKFFIWDPYASKVIKEIVIKPNSKSISGLTIYNSSTICGMNDNYFFFYNTVDNKVIKTIKIIEDKDFKNPMRGSTVSFKSKNEILISLNNKLYLLNPETEKVKLINSNTEKVFGSGSNIHYSNSSSLYKY